MKAAPLLRAWLHRLRAAGVRFHVRHRWLGWDGEGALRFAAPLGERAVCAEAVVLALGGGSWPQLGSDGAWLPLLAQRGVEVAPLRPANCGFDAGWSERFRARFAGQPVKSVVARCVDAAGAECAKQGEFVVTETGVEGGLIYALSAPLREALAAGGPATLRLDLAPGWEPPRLAAELSRPARCAFALQPPAEPRRHQGRQGRPAAGSCCRRGISPIPRASPPPSRPAAAAVAPRPLAEAISSAGGVAFEALDAH
jgi:predicted flavoprotein YhiN